MPVTLAQIEDAIVALLESKLDAARKIEIQKGFEGIPQPAVYVCTEEGKFSRITQSTYKEDVTIYVDIVFKHLNKEEQRRKGIYPILAACVQLLLLQDLGLKIDPLKPQNFYNSTSEELKAIGIMAYSLRIETGFYVSRMDEQDTADLLRVGLNYYLQPDDETVDAIDLLTVQELPQGA